MSLDYYEAANAALDYLLNKKQSSTYFCWIATRQLFREVIQGGDSRWDHKNFRDLMNRLYRAGAVERQGVGKFEWKIKVTEWKRNNPFANQTKDVNNPTPYTKPTPVHNHQPKYIEKTEDKNYITLKEKPEPNNALVLRMEEMVKNLTQIAVTQSGEIKEIREDLNKAKAEVESAKAAAAATVRVLKIVYPDNKIVKLKDKVLPKVFQRVLDLAMQRRNILLVGPAGAGKTYLAKLIADTLSLEFAALSCTAGMSESHLLGRSVPDLMKGQNKFQGTDFLRVYESGGVGLLDEFDAADPNLLLCVNSGLANGYMNLPNRAVNPRAERHTDFVCIATANTFGRGATRMYAGRNQLDEATLDRFRIGIVECDYDFNVEAAICPDIGGEEGKAFLLANGHEVQSKTTIKKLVSCGYNLRHTCHFIRDRINKSGMRRIMSSRFMEDAYIMMLRAEWKLDQVLEAYFEGWSPEECAKIA